MMRFSLFRRRALSRGAAEDLASLSQVRAQSPWRRRAIIVSIYAAVVLLCAAVDPKKGAHGTDTLFEAVEFYAYRFRIGILARQSAGITEWVRQNIVLVPLSDETFDKNEGNIPGPPAPRSYHAKVVRDLTRAGVKGIVFDMVFESESTPKADDDFAKAMRESKGTFIGCWMSDNGTLQKPIAKLSAASHLAHILLPQEKNQLVVDRVEPVVRSPDGQYIPSLSLAGAMQHAGLGNAPIRPARGGWKIGGFFLPVNENGTYSIKLWDKPVGDAGTEVFPFIPYEQLYDGAVDDPFYQQNHFFKDKIVVIGDITKLGNDFRLTVLGQMPGMEIQAHAMGTLMATLEKNFTLLREAPLWANFLMIALLAAIACYIAAVWRPQIAVGGMFAVILSYAVVNVMLFVNQSYYLHFMAPSAAVFLTTMGVLAERILSEERQKTWMRGLLQRYVSPQVADYLVAHPEKLNLGGEMVTATVLFSDIRGFTAVSRRFEAQTIVGLLNEYLQTMTDVIWAYDGTLDKYMGDGIMVVFGAPEPYEDHARRAVAVAIDMQTAMGKLRENWGARGLPMLDIGVGIATGTMISGNMGATQRTELTVIGDTVNLASRIEGLNKEIGTKLLIHESTYVVVQSEIEARGPIALPVKGHDEDVIVYEIFGWKAGEGMKAEG